MSLSRKYPLPSPNSISWHPGTAKVSSLNVLVNKTFTKYEELASNKIRDLLSNDSLWPLTS